MASGEVKYERGLEVWVRAVVSRPSRYGYVTVDVPRSNGEEPPRVVVRTGGVIPDAKVQRLGFEVGDRVLYTRGTQEVLKVTRVLQPTYELSDGTIVPEDGLVAAPKGPTLHEAIEALSRPHMATWHGPHLKLVLKAARKQLEDGLEDGDE